MRCQIRAAWLAGMALVVLASSSSAVAAATHTGPAPSRSAMDQPLTWAIVPSLNRGTHNNSLNGISCASAGRCTAVGFATLDGVPKALAETWNGTAWSIVASPSRPGGNVLYGVSCLSARACTAVGTSYRRTEQTEKTLIESWNGTAWSIVRSPNPSPAQDRDVLFGVSCISVRACTAVGFSTTNRLNVPLIESWNGKAWSVVPSPRKRITSGLIGVSCVAADTCTAVGGYISSTLSDKTLIESWNGATWKVVPSPITGVRGGDLYDITCVAANSCVAVGGDSRTLTESWNGSAWSVVHSPDRGNVANTLNSVSCTAADSCTAVGRYLVGLTQLTLIESWNGTAWSVVPSPNAPKSSSSLAGVSCPATTTCIAVGWRKAASLGSSSRTLAELGT